MFCVHCGSKLPDEAKFCGNCGEKVLVIPAAPPPMEQPPVEESIRQAPMQESVQEEPVWQPPVNQEPVKEEPVWQPPVNQEPVKEEPVWQPPANQKPVKEEPILQEPAKQEPVRRTPPAAGTFIPPTKENWAPPSGYQFNPNSRIKLPKVDLSQVKIPKINIPKKLLIPLIAAGAVLLLIFTAIIFYSLGSSDREPTPDKSNKASVSETMDQRYDEDGFYFSHKEFKELYAQVLKDNDSPFDVGKSEYSLDTGRQWDLLYKNKPAIYFNTTEDPTSGRITTVKAGTNGLTTGYEEVTDEEIEAIHYLVEACHGPLTKSQWSSILNADYSLDTSTIKIKDVKLDGLSIKITQTDSTYTIEIYAGAPQQKSNTIQMESDEPVDVDSGIFDRYPNGKKRFSGTTFLFNHEEYAELFNATLEEEGYDYRLANPRDLGDNKFNYALLYQGNNVGYSIIEENSSGKVVHISFNYNFDKSKSVTQNGIDACLTGIKAAHGNMSQADWNSFYQKKASVVRDDYTFFSYDLTGLSANMLVYKNRIYLETDVA